MIIRDYNESCVQLTMFDPEKIYCYACKQYTVVDSLVMGKAVQCENRTCRVKGVMYPSLQYHFWYIKKHWPEAPAWHE